jgi:hypothetical protein
MPAEPPFPARNKYEQLYLTRQSPDGAAASGKQMIQKTLRIRFAVLTALFSASMMPL